MTLLSAGALAGLVLLVPLVALHLRRQPPADYEVPSLLLWDGLEQPATPRSRGRRLPRLPLLLLLQALALVLLVVALARPAATASPPAPVHVYVLDDSLWMGVPGRLAVAQLRIQQLAARLRGAAPVRIVLANGSPKVIYRGPAAGVTSALRLVGPGLAPSSLAPATALAAGLLGSPRDRVVLLRAPEDRVPRLRAGAGELHTVVIGVPVADQGIFSPSARCGIAGATGCEVLATLSSTAQTPVTDRYTAYARGEAFRSGVVHLAAHSSAGLAFSAPAGAQIRIRLLADDALSVDDQAWISVPGGSGVPPSTVVTLVGAPSESQALARAFAAVPGVTLRLRTASDYRPADARSSELTIVDGALPGGELPPSPAVALIDPSSVPGGGVRGPLADSTLSGEDATSRLVSGLDLSSLSIAPGAVHQIVLPGYLMGVVWSPDGPLLAAGEDGSRRVAVLSFDPARSDLPQLAAFPILASNLVRWAAGWTPAEAPAGEPLPIDGTPGATGLALTLNGTVVARRPLHGAVARVPISQPGLYTVTETGPGIDRRATVAVSVAQGAPDATSAAPPVDLTAARVRGASTHGPSRAPWLLGAAIVVLLLEWAYWRRRVATAAPGAPAGGVWTALAAGGVVLLVIAVAHPQWGAPRPETVLAVDGSASIDANMRATEDAWARAIAHARCPDPCRVVPFAAGSKATDIETGVNTAVGLLSPGGRAVILSDGWQTSGDPFAAAANARAANVELDYVRLSDPLLRDAAVTAIHAPSAVHAGDPIPLQVTVRSTVTASATLYVVRDGRAIGSQFVRLRDGENPFLLSYTAPGPGWHSFQARIVLHSDAVPVNDALAATVDVVAAPRVLEVAPAGSPGDAVASTLRREGLALTVVTPSGLPTAVASLAGLDAIVLDDVPAAALNRAQVAALRDAVAAGGLGLLVLGGPHSFSLAGYAHTSLEQMLPVASLVPGALQRGNVAIESVLDHSGSMIDLLGGIPKIDALRIAGAQVAHYIGAHHDDLGIVDFDIAPHVLVPMQSVDSAAAERGVVARVDGLQASGGTNIYAGLRAGLAQLERSNARDKHMILMTDGISEPEKYAPLLARLASDHIQVATVALGSDADTTLLRRIAQATGGHYYRVTNAHSLPAVFYRETQFAVRPVAVRGHVTVSVGGDSPVIRSLLGGSLPALRGNVITTLKAGAQADLLAAAPSARKNPALARWQDGAGRVVAFTPGLGAPFAPSWAAEPRLWNDAVRWVQRGVGLPDLTPTVVPGAPPSLEIDLAGAGAGAFGVSAVTGALRSSTGASYPVALTRVGASVYRAALPGVPPGVYGFDLGPQGVAGVASTGLIAVPYSLEYVPRPGNDTPLGALAALTGGRALRPSQPGSLSSPGPASLWWPLALGALLLFLVSVIGRQLAPPTTLSYAATSPAIRAEVDSTSSTEMSVGAGR